MPEDVEQLSDGTLLLDYLTDASVERGERLSIERSGDEWVAAFLVDSGLRVEAVILHANGPDRRTAMLRLARLVAQVSER